MKYTNYIFLLYFFLIIQTVQSQNVELYQQFNGRYDYTAIGNTMNIQENGTNGPCEILTTSSATLNLSPDQEVIAAYLYWAGSGTGDFNIMLNEHSIVAERIFNDALDSNRVFFAAFADVTSIVQENGSGNYTLSELDLTDIIGPYCPSGTNFAGWAITVIYEDNNLPLNQLNVYDGLQSVPDQLTISLDNLNVLDNEGAKIGFIAWEGDQSLAVTEQLTINGNLIGNPPLNPTNNAFNGTNSFTGANDLFNMDIDVYNIQNNINIGDTSAVIQLTSGQDFVMINNIITVLNSQLPDATIVINDYILECNSKTISVNFTVSNTNSTAILPAHTPISFYANDFLIAQTQTNNDIPINESENYNITLDIPETLGNDFDLHIVVDDLGDNTGIVTEINENNNTYSETITMLVNENVEFLGDILKCDQGFNSAIFNLNTILKNWIEPQTPPLFYTNLQDLYDNINPIFDSFDFNNTSNPQTIYVKIPSEPCYSIYTFDIEVENCPPHIPEGFSPNHDGINDWFNIQGLYNIFEKHQLLIYNRYGTLIFEGNNDTPWNGKTNRGINNIGKLVPSGTYYYILHLNDPNYKTLTGWVYVNY